MTQPKAPKGLPDVVDITATELDAILAELKKAHLKPTTLTLVQRCLELALWIPHALQSNKISLHRLKVLMFGKGYCRKNKNKGSTDQAGNTTPSPPVVFRIVVALTVYIINMIYFKCQE